MTHRPEVVARFEREAVALGRIDHPHVAAATDFGKLDQGHFYLALEYVDGTSLRDVLRGGPLSTGRARAVALQISAALEAAHGLGIVHRDLKPENIMLLEKDGFSDFVKVLDFGIAKLGESDTRGQKKLTRMGAVFGTPEYMSPEQAMGAPVDARSDIYALGVLLYEMLAGKTPFSDGEMMTLLTRVMTEPPPKLPPSVDANLSRIVARLLEKKADARPTLEELNRELVKAPAASAPVSRIFDKEKVSRHFDDLSSQLRKPLRIGEFEVARGLLALVAAGGLLLGVVLVRAFSSSDEDDPGAKATLGKVIASRKIELPEPVPSSDLEGLEQKELARIEELPVYKRTREDWLTLARTTAKLGRHKDSVLAYQAVLSLKGSMGNDEILLRDMRRAGLDEESFKLVVNLCANRLGTAGIDILWDVWLELKQVPQRSEDAEFLRKRLRVLTRRASPELRTAIELRTSESCEKLAQSVSRATEHSDQRALPRLKELQIASKCPADTDAECFRCLEGNPDLDRAIAHAEKTPPPKPH
jgi:serine/threonine-protein kinase